MTPVKNLILLILLILTSFTVHASDTSSQEVLLAEEVFNNVDNLIEDKKYESAWTLLHEHAESLDFADLIIKKTELCLRYFVLTNRHGMFAFTDLEGDENLLELRKQQNNYELKLFDPEGGLKMALQGSPDRGELYYWLGEFYNEVLSFYGDTWNETQDDLRNHIQENFEKALSLGMETEDIYAKLAHTELLKGEWDQAAEHLTQAMAYDREDAAYYQNLAIAQLNLDRLAQAEVNAELAINLYTDPLYKADTCFLASTIALYRSRTDSAADYLNKGFKLSPGDFRFPDRLIRLHLSQENYEDARRSAEDLFGLYPENPETCNTIIQYFFSHQRLDETRGFFETQLKKYGERPEVMGNLYFHQALASHYQGLEYEALDLFDLAEEEFNKTDPPNPLVFDAIKKMRGIISGQ
jgi:tetratricopeptide (TPR) repeat protein